MRSLLRFHFAFCLPLALVAGANAQTAYAIDFNNQNSRLYRVDLPTATATLVGGTGLYLEGLAYNAASGKLYATGANGNLYSLSTTSGAATIIGSTGRTDPEGLAYGGSTLYCTDLNTGSNIYSVDPTTGAATLARTGSLTTNSLRAMTFADDGSLAYVLGDTAGAGSRCALYTIAASGAETSLGSLTDPDQTGAMVNVGGNRLYALDISGREYRLDPTNGTETLVGNTGFQTWLDMTLATPAAVPEPSAFVALGLGAFTLLKRRQRRA